MEKVIISIIDGEVSLIQKPDYVDIEVRDYVTVDDDEVYPEIHKDDDGDTYRVFSFPVETESTPVEDVEMLYENHYRCEDCDVEWDDRWDSMCDDECGECGTCYSPYESIDLNEVIGFQPQANEFPIAGLRSFEVYESLTMGKECHPEVKGWVGVRYDDVEAMIVIPKIKKKE